MRKIDIDAIVIASPCAVPWDSMTGDEVRRYCGQCRLNVYDLSQMTRAQIQTLYVETGGSFCKRVWRRPDGRVITKDCRRVVSAMRRRLRAIGAAAAGLLAFAGLVGCGAEPAPKGSNGSEANHAAPTTTPDATVATGR